MTFLRMIGTLLILACCAFHFNEAVNTTESPESTFKILLAGDKNINFGNNKELIVVLGVTGSGKSTLVHFLAGNNSELIGERRGFDIVIKDTNNKISQATTKSQTLYPEIITDIENENASFVDCPGFFDTRNTSLEIATSYFIQKVFNNAEKVKIILTISHSAVRLGNERRGFTDLLSYAANIISNVDKFQNGIAIVVTKVDNYPVASDTEIIDFIREFLTEAKVEIQSRVEDENKLILNAKMVKIIDNLLENNNGSKIGIFRRPLSEGLISNSSILQQQKLDLKTMIYENTNYVQNDETDFNNALSSQSILYIKDILLPIVDRNISDFFTNSANKLDDKFKLKGEASHDIYNFRDSLITDYTDFKIYENQNLSELKIKEIIIACKNHINVSESRESEISSLISQSEIYRRFVANEDNDYYNTWAKPILNFIKYLKNLKIWYSFLPDCFNAMSQYDFQSKRDRFLERIGNEVSNDNFKSFLTRSGDLHLQNISVLNEIVSMGMNVDNFILRDINRVINDGAKSISFSCQNNYNFEAIGNFILLSEVMTKSQTICSQPVKSISIFAMDTIYIDSNIDKKGLDFQLILIAPKLEVIGNVNILLDGTPGGPITPVKAANSASPSQKGADGIAGTPGSPGGNFYGLAQVYVNSQNLLISTNGGNGGPGQHGGDGKIGRSGTWPDVPYGGNRDDFINQIRGRGYHFTENAGGTGHRIYVFLNRRGRDYDYAIYGHPGSAGSNGGLGGQGGIGASPGVIQIINLEQKNEIRKVSNAGNRGAGGVGGTGGPPGGNVGIKYIRCSKVKKYILMFKRSERWECHQRGQTESGYTAGLTGEANTNQVGLAQPRSPIPLQADTAKFKNIYKSKIPKRIDAKFKLAFLDLLVIKNI